MTNTSIHRKTDPRLAALITVGLSLVILMAVALPTLVLARPQGLGGPGGGGMHRGHGMERMLELLDLSEQQREEIHAILDVYKPEFETQTDLMKVAREALHNQIQADLFDEAAIRQAAANVATIEADLAVLRARVTNDVRPILTPEQRAEALEMRETVRAFQELRSERRGQRRSRTDD